MEFRIGEVITGLLTLLGGYIAVKCWLGKVLKGLGESYQALLKAERDGVISRDEEAEIGHAITPALIEIKQRLQGITPFRWRF